MVKPNASPLGHFSRLFSSSLYVGGHLQLLPHLPWARAKSSPPAQDNSKLSPHPSDTVSPSGNRQCRPIPRQLAPLSALHHPLHLQAVRPHPQMLRLSQAAIWVLPAAGRTPSLPTEASFPGSGGKRAPKKLESWQ